MAKKTKKGASRAKTAARRSSSPKRSAKVDGRTVRKMKCPEPGCRRKSRGPRYNYYCDLHEGKSEAAKEKGLLRRRAEDDPSIEGSKPFAIITSMLAQDLASRCVFVTTLLKLGRCVRSIHDGDDHHLYAAPQSIPPAARTDDERVELVFDPTPEPAPQEGEAEAPPVEAPPVTTTAPQSDPPTDEAVRTTGEIQAEIERNRMEAQGNLDSSSPAPPSSAPVADSIMNEI